MSDNHDQDIQESKGLDQGTSASNEDAHAHHATEIHGDGNAPKQDENSITFDQQSESVPSEIGHVELQASKATSDSSQNTSGIHNPASDHDDGSPSKATDSSSKPQDHSAVPESNHAAANDATSSAINNNDSAAVMSSAQPASTPAGGDGSSQSGASTPNSKLNKWLNRSKTTK
jgi:hypothetical protein